MRFIIIAASLLLLTPCVAADGPSRGETVAAMHRAVRFFRQYASAGDGYVYQLSADLMKREGEGVVGATTAWIEPPGTPTVGLAYLNAYRLTGDPVLLDSAKTTAHALVRGQLESGGWDNKIEFDASERKKYAYRVDNNRGKKLLDTTTFDDDKSQSAIRFLMQLDNELKYQNVEIHQCVRAALDSVVRSQYSCGAWPQRFSEFPQPGTAVAKQASIPETWSRTFPKTKYAELYTLNDNTMGDLIETMLDAWEVYGKQEYLTAAVRGGDFFLLAQLPEPQPGWAQQYDANMQPAWARKFEPPAVTGGESQGVMRSLMALYARTAPHIDDAERFLEPIPRALKYYRRSLRDDGRLARFYELGTNRPLYFTKDYQLTYSDQDMPTHYGFVVDSKLDQIQRQLESLQKQTTPRRSRWKGPTATKKTQSLAKAARQAIEQLDDRGAWVESGRLRYHGDDDDTTKVIRSVTFCKNLITLADWIAANR
ncbi:MAG: polysaccharide lyase [Pirellulaceae bacterium]|nr:polysaccharide lyase [Pirellulaceae bacterium]